MILNKEQHWNEVYHSKSKEVTSWFQENPKTSIEYIQKLHLPKQAAIIDIGGGESKVVDCLLDLGYTNITVLDISEVAIQKTQKRLGERSKEVTWVVSDMLKFQPEVKYDVWHDRATFHFLKDDNEIKQYIGLVHQNLNEKGYLILGTFSEDGPNRCGGLDTKRYSDKDIHALFHPNLNKNLCETVEHKTPSNANQQFVFCVFQKN